LHDLPAKPRSAPHALRGTAGQEEPATESSEPTDTPGSPRCRATDRAAVAGPADGV